MSLLRRAAILALALATGSLGVAMPSAAAAPPHAISIGQARSLPLGSVVTVSGTATTPSGWTESSSFDKGFGLQDLTGGIYVSVPADPHVKPRDRIRVTGALQDSYGLLILVPDGPAGITIHGRGLPILPRWLATGAVNEQSEGSLVRVVAKVTQAPESDLPYGHKFLVDDGSGELTVFVSVQSGIDLSRIVAGPAVVVTGFSGQFDTHYEIIPRFPSDVLVLPTL
ncbi:hypothetical protein Cme02nite_65270 [Catellatospora methionotrophica]|uniref:DNA-binding protein n=1 Tax=Catellatospora methionotrophica TaxID=121620 RepID=A0A8J3LSQ7_9ACTN|nr:hypothetical protein [Catellatospora methionotrophica]GIG18195.1 hypothetical protein Cme02nite_65270 [Catellatospora methionotrophica]